MPRRLIALWIMLALPAVAAAQEASGARRGRSQADRQAARPHPGPHEPDPAPNWAITPRGEVQGRGVVQLPRIGVPLPPIGLRPSTGRHHRKPPRRVRHRIPAPWVIYVPQIVEVVEAPGESEPQLAEPPMGRLILDIQPETAQVYAGGYYLGTAANLSPDGGGATLEAGPYRIDVSAPGYEDVTFLATIRENQPTTYRQQLKRVEPAAPAPAAGPGTPPTFYLIPGCYMGNVPPQDARLPATCDVSRAVKF